MRCHKEHLAILIQPKTLLLMRVEIFLRSSVSGKRRGYQISECMDRSSSVRLMSKQTRLDMINPMNNRRYD